MNSINDIQDERVRHLATTLKQSGLAASETEAIRMATAMSHTSNKVNQTFEERKGTAPTLINMHKRESPSQTQEKEAPKREFQEKQDARVEIPRTAEQIVASMRETETIRAVPTAENNNRNQYMQQNTELEPDLSNMSLAEASGQTPNQNIEQNQETPELSFQNTEQKPIQNEAPIRVEEKEDYKIEFKDDEEFIVQDVTRSQETTNNEQNIQQTPQNEQPQQNDQKQGFQTPERKPKKNISEMEESRVDLGSVFNFNKK
ncbi:hypothetical protein K9L67_00590 [Candidatus Woesearchaeota archaeon]|nr:hypothetical protein [Candidatus Woesearchaeota archaeon]MCF7900704.1 hypothetical protein [Candidatus Woesearchaeota archaeon]MCF8013225.1 hypothetical protein [Candidatus Woesearchaeota archaeon]